MNKLLVLASCALFLVSCASNEISNSSDVEQNKIHQAYSIVYNGNDNETHVKATFRFGGANGTTLVLTPPSTVQFNGKEMTRYESDLVGAYYKAARNGPLANGLNCKFIFTNTNNKKYTNTVKFNPVLLGKIPAEANNSSPLKFVMKTKPLTYGERIIIKLQDTSHSEEIVLQDQNLKKQMIIPATVLKKLKGKVRMNITRFYNSILQEATEEEGTISVEYKTKERTFFVK